MTTGFMMYYGGITGIAAGILILIIISKIFSRQRRKMRENEI